MKQISLVAAAIAILSAGTPAIVKASNTPTEITQQLKMKKHVLTTRRRSHIKHISKL